MGHTTMRDVARLAGVSRSAVSNYYNHPDLVSVSSASKIRAAIDALSFVPHAMAQSLRAGKTQTVGLVLPDAFIPIFGEMGRGTEEAAFSRGWRTYIASSDFRSDREADYVSRFISSHVDGMVIYPVGDVRHHIDKLNDRGIPAVVMGNNSPRVTPDDVSSVAIDDRLGGRLVGEHLVSVGRRNIAFVGNIAAYDISERYRGLLEATNGTGADVSVHDVEDLSVGAGVRVASQILGRKLRPDAIFAGTDMLAFGVMQTLLQDDVRIPEDIALVGYDDIEFSRQLVVPLTTVQVPAREMGAASIDLLDAAVAGDPPQRIVMRPKLVVRRSG